MKRTKPSRKTVLALSSSCLLIFVSFGAHGSGVASLRAGHQSATALGSPIVTGAEISGKVLTVLGQNFSEGAEVLINGEKQKKTSFESSVRLIAKKSGKKLKTGDNLQVRNPDGSISPDFFYNLQPYAITVAANDFVYSPVTDRLYASVSSQAPQYANSIAIINAQTTQVEATIPVGRQPDKLAFSDDYH